MKLGAKGQVQEEMKMYAKATKADPKFGGAWLNWGTALAESGNTDDAELMFLKAMECGPEVVSKALMNISIIYVNRGNSLAQGGDLDGAMKTAVNAAKYMDQGKSMMDALVATSKADSDIGRFIQQYKPLRLQAHRLIGQLHAGSGDFVKSEAEFRKAAENFPDDITAWKMLERILQVQGKTEELQAVAEKVTSLGF